MDFEAKDLGLVPVSALLRLGVGVDLEKDVVEAGAKVRAIYAGMSG